MKLEIEALTLKAQQDVSEVASSGKNLGSPEQIAAEMEQKGSLSATNSGAATPVIVKVPTVTPAARMTSLESQVLGLEKALEREKQRFAMEKLALQAQLEEEQKIFADKMKEKEVLLEKVLRQEKKNADALEVVKITTDGAGTTRTEQEKQKLLGSSEQGAIATARTGTKAEAHHDEQDPLAAYAARINTGCSNTENTRNEVQLRLKVEQARQEEADRWEAKLAKQQTAADDASTLLKLLHEQEITTEKERAEADADAKWRTKVAELEAAHAKALAASRERAERLLVMSSSSDVDKTDSKKMNDKKDAQQPLPSSTTNPNATTACNADLLALRLRNASLESDLEELRAELDRAKEDVVEQSTRLQKKMQEQARRLPSPAELGLYRTELEHVRKQLVDARTDKKAVAREVVDLQRAMDAERAELKQDLADSQRTLKMESEKFESEKFLLGKQISGLKSDKDTLLQEMADKEQRARDRENDRRRELDLAETRAREKEFEVQEKALALELITTERDRIAEDRRRLLSEKEKLQSEKEHEAEAKIAMESELSTEKRKRETQLAEVEVGKKALVAQVGDLRASNATNEAEVKRLERLLADKIRDKEMTIKTLKLEVAELTEKVNKLNGADEEDARDGTSNRTDNRGRRGVVPEAGSGLLPAASSSAANKMISSTTTSSMVRETETVSTHFHARSSSQPPMFRGASADRSTSLVIGAGESPAKHEILLFGGSAGPSVDVAGLGAAVGANQAVEESCGSPRFASSATRTRGRRTAPAGSTTRGKQSYSTSSASQAVEQLPGGGEGMKISSSGGGVLRASATASRTATAQCLGAPRPLSSWDAPLSLESRPQTRRALQRVVKSQALVSSQLRSLKQIRSILEADREKWRSEWKSCDANGEQARLLQEVKQVLDDRARKLNEDARAAKASGKALAGQKASLEREMEIIEKWEQENLNDDAINRAGLSDVPLFADTTLAGGGGDLFQDPMDPDSGFCSPQEREDVEMGMEQGDEIMSGGGGFTHRFAPPSRGSTAPRRTANNLTTRGGTGSGMTRSLNGRPMMRNSIGGVTSNQIRPATARAWRDSSDRREAVLEALEYNTRIAQREEEDYTRRWRKMLDSRILASAEQRDIRVEEQKLKNTITQLRAVGGGVGTSSDIPARSLSPQRNYEITKSLDSWAEHRRELRAKLSAHASEMRSIACEAKALKHRAWSARRHEK
ncbi:unnamed protein product [Amoebophrya sp. A25]|nr:unnamed protein product [Amoebophrya sp. A25]|eukprot:GSA25T00020437001.1